MIYDKKEEERKIKEIVMEKKQRIKTKAKIKKKGKN